MRILVTGANGQLGYDVIKTLEMRNISCRGYDLEDFDLTNRAQTREAILAYKPDAVIHCAAYTAVDKAESEEDICRRVNVEGTANVAEACRDIRAKMLHISTDYVFDGEGERPFEEDDPHRPINVYGKTKSQSEQKVKELLDDYAIIRISWTFGANGHNFVKTMLRLGVEKEELTVVSDQIGSPTFTGDLALLLLDMVQKDSRGTFHATNEGFVSWAEFAREIMAQAKLQCRVTPILTRDYPSAAKRPLNSRLSKASLDRADLRRLPAWEDALSRYIKILQN